MNSWCRGHRILIILTFRVTGADLLHVILLLLIKHSMLYLIFSFPNLLRLWNWENWHSRLLIAASVLNGQQSSSTKLSISWRKMTKHGFCNLQEISLKGIYAPYILLKCLLLWKGAGLKSLNSLQPLYSSCHLKIFYQLGKLLSLSDKLPCRYLDPFLCLCCPPAIFLRYFLFYVH